MTVKFRIEFDRFKAFMYDVDGEIRLQIEETQEKKLPTTSTLKERKFNISELFVENDVCSIKILFGPNGLENSRFYKPRNLDKDKINNALGVDSKKQSFSDVKDEMLEKCVQHGGIRANNRMFP